MKGDSHIVVHLNQLLGDELIAVNQYFLHSRVFESMGLERLKNIEYKECTDELNHADYYTKRILFLESVPILKNFDLPNIKKDIEFILNSDLDLEFRSVNNLREGIAYSDSIQDYISRDIMVKVLYEEEQHIDFLEKELDLLRKIGLKNYIQSQLIDKSL